MSALPRSGNRASGERHVCLIRLDVDVMDGGFNLDDFLLHAIDFVADGLNDFFTVKRQRTVHSLRIRRY